jgi:hypothetical protein
MGSLRSRHKLFVGGALTALSLAALTTASAQHSPRQPDFSSDQVGWIATNPDFIAVPGGPSPTRSDPAHPYVPNGTGRSRPSGSPISPIPISSPGQRRS